MDGGDDSIARSSARDDSRALESSDRPSVRTAPPARRGRGAFDAV